MAVNLEQTQTYIDFVKENLEPLAKQLKVGVEWLWDILVMQARVEAIVLLCTVLGLSIATITLTTIFLKNFPKARYTSPYGRSYVYRHKENGLEEKYYSDIPAGEYNDYEKIAKPKTNKEYYVSLVSGIGAAIMLVVSIITSSTSLPTIVTGLVNPEYRAIESIVTFAKPKVEQAAKEAK